MIYKNVQAREDLIQTNHFEAFRPLVNFLTENIAFIFSSLLQAGIQELADKFSFDGSLTLEESHAKLQNVIRSHLETIINQVQEIDEKQRQTSLFISQQAKLLYEKVKEDARAIQQGHVLPIEETQTYKFLQRL